MCLKGPGDSKDSGRRATRLSDGRDGRKEGEGSGAKLAGVEAKHGGIGSHVRMDKSEIACCLLSSVP